MADPLAEYTVRDFSAVDRQIEQIAERERVVTQKLRLANLFQILKFAVIGLIAAGVFFVLLGIAYRVAFPPEQKVVEKTKVIRDSTASAQPQTIVIQTPAGTVLNPNPEKPETQSMSQSSPIWGNKISPPAEQSGKILNSETTYPRNDVAVDTQPNVIGQRSVTTFTSIPSQIPGFTSIHTGWKWDNMNAKRPNQQYCYVNKPGSDGVQERIDLANKAANESELNNLYSPRTSSAAGLSKTQWNNLIQKCKWF